MIGVAGQFKFFGTYAHKSHRSEMLHEIYTDLNPPNRDELQIASIKGFLLHKNF